jgi:hypothetical protein
LLQALYYYYFYLMASEKHPTCRTCGRFTQDEKSPFFEKQTSFPKKLCAKKLTRNHAHFLDIRAIRGLALQSVNDSASLCPNCFHMQLDIEAANSPAELAASNYFKKPDDIAVARRLWLHWGDLHSSVNPALFPPPPPSYSFSDPFSPNAIASLPHVAGATITRDGASSSPATMVVDFAVQTDLSSIEAPPPPPRKRGRPHKNSLPDIEGMRAVDPEGDEEPPRKRARRRGVQSAFILLLSWQCFASIFFLHLPSST